MKKLIGLLMLFVLVLNSCGVEKEPDGSWKTDRSRIESATESPFVEIIDSCEYVIWGRGMAHKGDCKRCRKHYEELIRTYCDSHLDASRVH